MNHSGQLPSVTHLASTWRPGVSIGDAVTAVEAAAAPIVGTGITASFAGTAQAFPDAQRAC